MSKQTPAQIALMNETAKRVRTAIDKRNENLAKLIEEYDEALEHGDDDKVHAAGLMLIVFSSGMLDPVTSEVQKWAELDKMLKRAETVPADTSARTEAPR